MRCRRRVRPSLRHSPRSHRSRIRRAPSPHQLARIDMTGDCRARRELVRSEPRRREVRGRDLRRHVAARDARSRRDASVARQEADPPGDRLHDRRCVDRRVHRVQRSDKKKVVAKAPIAHVDAREPADRAERGARRARSRTVRTPACRPPSTESPNAATASAAADAPSRPRRPRAERAAERRQRLRPHRPATTNPTIHDIQTTRGVVQLADVRIDSKPAGATVTLVEMTATGEKKSFLGTTPIATSLDASRTYDVVLALAGSPRSDRAPRSRRTRQHLSIALGKTAQLATPARPADRQAAPARAPKDGRRRRAEGASRCAPPKAETTERRRSRLRFDARRRAPAPRRRPRSRRSPPRPRAPAR